MRGNHLFILTATFRDLLSNTSQIKQVQTDKSAHVEIVRLSRAVVSEYGAPVSSADILEGQQFPAMRVWLYDNAVGKYLSNAPVPIVNMFGSSLYPGILAQPILLGANATLTVTVFNDYTAYDVGYLQLAFLGRKVKEY